MDQNQPCSSASRSTSLTRFLLLLITLGGKSKDLESASSLNYIKRGACIQVSRKTFSNGLFDLGFQASPQRQQPSLLDVFDSFDHTKVQFLFRCLNSMALGYQECALQDWTQRQLRDSEHL